MKIVLEIGCIIMWICLTLLKFKNILDGKFYNMYILTEFKKYDDNDEEYTCSLFCLSGTILSVLHIATYLIITLPIANTNNRWFIISHFLKLCMIEEFQMFWSSAKYIKKWIGL